MCWRCRSCSARTEHHPQGARRSHWQGDPGELRAGGASIGLTFYDSGARSIYNSTKPVRTLADIKGLRIRVQQSELMVEMIKALGAVPVELPYGQVLTGLGTKLIDGAENNWPSYRHHRSLQGRAVYYTLTEHTMSPEVLVMSHEGWEHAVRLRTSKIFREAASDPASYMREQMEALWRPQSRKAGQACRRRPS